MRRGRTRQVDGVRVGQPWDAGKEWKQRDKRKLRRLLKTLIRKEHE